MTRSPGLGSGSVSAPGALVTIDDGIRRRRTSRSMSSSLMYDPLHDPLAEAIDEEEEEEDHERRKGEEEPRDGGGGGRSVETRGPVAPARRSSGGGSAEMRSPEFASEKRSPEQQEARARRREREERKREEDEDLDHAHEYANQTHAHIIQQGEAIKMLAKDRRTLRQQRTKKDATITRLREKIAALEATVKAQEEQMKKMEEDGEDIQGGGAFLSDDDDFEEDENTEEEDYEFLDAGEDDHIPIDVDEE
ncbi:hypothetical protein QYE76_021653 [Lolium multiflorum]|uniref:Uncharacterized protein n=1 Tax=Lolium multiflorum TaxID=4521 RepID=A0AAD8R8S6_LOLMU|nr:hypothetical protein QYE76_021653 [Lolium multiflorum]